MLNSDLHTQIKTQARKWLMTLTLLLSFFAISGYVNTTLPNNNRATDTEVLTVNFSVLKGGISYKRASLLFYKNLSSYFLINKNFTHGVLLFNKLTVNRYQHLKQIFSLTRRTINYPTLHLYYTADQHKATSSFQIG